MVDAMPSGDHSSSTSTLGKPSAADKASPGSSSTRTVENRLGEAPATPSQALKRTPLYRVHVALGAKIVPFAGFEMPVQYPTGITAEHRAVRERAGLFDVSHMGEFVVRGDRVVDSSTTSRRTTWPRSRVARRTTPRACTTTARSGANA